MFEISLNEYNALSNPQKYYTNNDDYHDSILEFYDKNALVLNSYNKKAYNKKYFQYQMIYQYTEEYLKNKKSFIEVGCASGLQLFMFAPHFKHVFGLDIVDYEATAPKNGNLSAVELAQELVKQTNSTVTIKTGILNDLSKDKMFDVIFSNNVLEHIPNMQEFIDESVNRLNDGGLFIATVPNGYFLLRDIVRFNLDKLSLIRVLHRYTKNMILKILGKKISFSYGITPNGWCVPNPHSEFCDNFSEQFDERYELQNYLQPMLKSKLKILKVEIIQDDMYLIVGQKNIKVSQ